MNKEYLKMILKIFSSNDKILDVELKKLFKMQRESLDDILNYIARLFLDYGVDGTLKIKRFEKKKLKKEVNSLLESTVKKIGLFEVDLMENALSKVFKNTYDGINKTLKSGLKLIRPEHVKAVVNTSFKGDMYSDRIWKNKKNRMVKVLKKELNKAMQGEGDVNTISRKIKKEFNVQAYESERLARTEMARVQSRANEDIAKELGITEQMFDATLDSKTSVKCRELDGTFWAIDDENKPIPPLHPNCRSCLINVPYEGWKPSEKWDNENKKVTTYKKLNNT